MWHCPHCGAPQAESARCWVCRKSSTTCSTCRHFQTSLTNDVGWCGLDPRHRPLTGLEQRGCWEERPAAPQAPPIDASVPWARLRRRPAADVEPDVPPPLDFVPVELMARAATPSEPLDAGQPETLPTLHADAEEGWTNRTSLFGEPEG
jgi:hypothetical protein